MRKIFALIMVFALLITGCGKTDPSTPEATYLTMDSNASSTTLTLKVWLRSELSKENVSTFGKELVNGNKDMYGAIKIEFYKIKEEINYAQSTPEAIAIWGSAGKFVDLGNKDDNRFVVELMTQYKTFSDEEYELYNTYLETIKKNGDLKALAEANSLSYEKLMLLARDISLRFVK